MSARLLAALAALLLVLVACDTTETETPADDDPTPTEAVEAADLPDGVAATVNGSEIGTGAVDERVEIAKQNPAIQVDLEDDPETIEEVLAARVLSGLIMRQVVLDGAESMGIEASEDDVAAARTQLEETVGGEDAFAEQMAATGVPEAHLDEELHALALLHLVGEQLTDEATDGDDLDEEMRAHEVQRRSRTWLGQQMANAEVVVDLAYGRWDPAAGQVVPPIVDRVSDS